MEKEKDAMMNRSFQSQLERTGSFIHPFFIKFSLPPSSYGKASQNLSGMSSTLVVGNECNVMLTMLFRARLRRLRRLQRQGGNIGLAA